MRNALLLIYEWVCLWPACGRVQVRGRFSRQLFFLFFFLEIFVCDACERLNCGHQAFNGCVWRYSKGLMGESGYTWAERLQMDLCWKKSMIDRKLRDSVVVWRRWTNAWTTGKKSVRVRGGEWRKTKHKGWISWWEWKSIMVIWVKMDKLYSWSPFMKTRGKAFF